MKFDRQKPYNNLPLLPPKADVETKAILKKTITAGPFHEFVRFSCADNKEEPGGH